MRHSSLLGVLILLSSLLTTHIHYVTRNLDILFIYVFSSDDSSLLVTPCLNSE